MIAYPELLALPRILSFSYFLRKEIGLYATTPNMEAPSSL